MAKRGHLQETQFEAVVALPSHSMVIVIVIVGALHLRILALAGEAASWAR